jgi:hypothetical protein
MTDTPSAVIYAGYDGTDTSKPAIVVLETPEGESLGQLRHVVRHSPTGLSWGYGGSGPADLARSLLLDALGNAAKCPDCNGTGKVVWLRGQEDPQPFDPVRHADVPSVPDVDDDNTSWVEGCFGCHGEQYRHLPYMDFKFEVIAALPQGSWKLPRTEVLAWLRSRGIEVD